MSTQDNDDDSDLEIIPNPEPTSTNVLDLTTNDNTVQSVIDDMNTQQQKRQRSSKKRSIASIKQETAINESSVKRRKLNDDDHKPNISVKEEQKEIVITQKSASVSNQRTETVNTSTQNVFHLNFMSCGINYCGNCLHRNCIAYNKRITVKLGFGKFEPNKDAINCPGCSTAFTLDKIVLYKCVAVIRSRKLGETIMDTETVSTNGLNCVCYDYKVKETKTKVRCDQNNKSTNNSSSSVVRKKSQNSSQFLEFHVKPHLFWNFM